MLRFGQRNFGRWMTRRLLALFAVIPIFGAVEQVADIRSRLAGSVEPAGTPCVVEGAAVSLAALSAMLGPDFIWKTIRAEFLFGVRTMSSDRADCLAAGMDDHVAKPIGLKQLAAALERAEAGLQDAPIAQTPQAKGARAGGELGLPAFGGELVPKFFHFRSYYEEAVRFVSVGPVVVLVVAFGWPEVLGRAKLSNDAVRIDAGHFQIPHDFGTLLLLRFRVVENDGTVLGAFVVSLPVPRCGVVNREKHGQNFAKGTRFRIERHLHHLDMLRAAEANFLISRIGNPPAHISGNDRFDPGHLLKNGFDAPEAAAA